jgi:hypothetical protein
MGPHRSWSERHNSNAQHMWGGELTLPCYLDAVGSIQFGRTVGQLLKFQSFKWCFMSLEHNLTMTIASSEFYRTPMQHISDSTLDGHRQRAKSIIVIGHLSHGVSAGEATSNAIGPIFSATVGD